MSIRGKGVESETLNESAQIDDDWEPQDGLEEDDSEEDEPSWEERLCKDIPSLNLSFYSSLKRQSADLNRNDFENRLTDCLKRLGKDIPPRAIVVDLFQLAVEQRKHLAAFDAFKLAIGGPEFTKTLGYVRQEQSRMKQVAKLLDEKRKVAVPSKASEWHFTKIGGVRELVASIMIELRGEERCLEEQRSVWKRARQMKLESYLLEIAQHRIREISKSEKAHVASTALLVAYGHASKLAPYKDTDEDGEPIDAMRVRLSEIKNAKNRLRALSVLLLQL